MPALNIQIDVPNLGANEIEELKHKLTIYAQNLISASNKSELKAQQLSGNAEMKYSARLNRLRRLCGREIPTQDIQEDERLAYLIGK